jgi:hypothetical protein
MRPALFHNTNIQGEQRKGIEHTNSGSLLRDAHADKDLLQAIYRFTDCLAFRQGSRLAWIKSPD